MNSKALKTSIRKFANKFGYEIVKTHSAIDSIKVGSWLHNLNINTVIDIGSNEGQFIQTISKVLPKRKIFAFEPINSCYQNLVKNTSKYDVTAFNIGLGDTDGTVQINVSKNLVSSSILPMANLHKTLYPESAYEAIETIQIKRLDDVLSPHRLEQNIMVKIDVQGYEENVLKGGAKTIESSAVVIIETSFHSLYQNQWLFEDVFQFIAPRGFQFWGFADQSYSKNTGVPIYGDAIFIRKDLTENLA